jgi:predicted dehydrogenase
VSAGDFRLDPTRGGGALLDLGCYCLSAVAAALGDGLPSEVHGRMDRGGTEVDLTTDATLAFSSGASATVHCSMNEAGQQSIIITGREGSIEVPKPAFSAGAGETATLVIAKEGTTRRESFEPVDAFELMITQVSSRIRGGMGFTVSADHSLAVATMSGRVRHGQ